LDPKSVQKVSKKWPFNNRTVRYSIVYCKVNIQKSEIWIPEPFKNRTYLCHVIKWLITILFPVWFSNGLLSWAVLYIKMFIFKYFFCFKWSSLVEHLKTGHFCPVLEWLNKMAIIQQTSQIFKLAKIAWYKKIFSFMYKTF
jgi:hypothetical protein